MTDSSKLARLTLQELLDEVGDRDPAEVLIKVGAFPGKGVWTAGTVSVDGGGALVIHP